MSIAESPLDRGITHEEPKPENPGWENVERFLHYLINDKGSSENTVSAYRNDLAQLSEYLRTTHTGRASTVIAAGKEQLDRNDVTQARLVGFVVSLKDKGYASATLARKIAAVKSFFHWMIKENNLKVDPTDGLDSPKIGKTLPRTLSVEEVDKLISAPEAKIGSEAGRDSAMLRLLYDTGMRVSEMMSLDIQDIDLPSDYARCLGKEGRERHIPFGGKTHNALSEYINSNRPKLTRNRETNAIFVNHRGERLTRQGFWLILKGYAKAVGLQDSITPHTLRHTFAIHLLAHGAKLRDVQELLGHSNIATTQVYEQMLKSKAI